MEYDNTNDSGDVETTGEQRKNWIERQNIEIRDRMQPPKCVSSLSTLTGLSVGSKVSRTCQQIRTGRTAMSYCRKTPSLLLHGNIEWMPDEDQRILNLMVMRREAQIEEEEVLLSARNIWEKDRIQYNKMVNQKKQERNEYLQEKRRMDKEELERRKELISQNIQMHQQELKERINEKHAQSEFRYKKLTEQKRSMKGSWETDELFHRLRKEQLNNEEKTRSDLHLNEILSKESRAASNFNTLVQYRHRRLHERSYEREKKAVAARQVREALEQRYQEWCEDSMAMLNNKLDLCEYKAAKANELKKQMIHDRNQTKRLFHSHAILSIREDERLRESFARHELSKKDRRIRALREQKEQAKFRSRGNALITANLRQKIKSSFPLHM